MFIRKWPKCTEMYIPIFIYIHFIYLRSHFWKRPQTLVYLFSFAHCFPLFNFWPLAFEAGWFTRKQILSLRLVCRTFIRQDSGRGEEKEAGMGRRSWSVKHSQKSLSQPPESAEAGMAPQSYPKMGRGPRSSHPQLIKHWMLADLEGLRPWLGPFSSAEAIPKEGWQLKAFFHPIPSSWGINPLFLKGHWASHDSINDDICSFDKWLTQWSSI